MTEPAQRPPQQHNLSGPLHRHLGAKPEVVADGRGWKTLRDAEAVVEGREAAPWLFPAMVGTDGAQDIFRRVWARILDRAELRYRKPHTLRHTHASLLIQAGEPPTYVQQQLGHHSAAFTLTVYAHFVPRGDRRAVDALDDPTPTTDLAERAYPAFHARGA